MTGAVIDPVAVPATAVRDGRSPRAASNRPPPLPTVPTPRTGAAVYGTAAVDCRRRVADRAVFAALRHVRRHFITRDNLRAAIGKLVNATFAVRDPQWWGQGTTCASDSKKFGSWESNLMTEWHQRYGGPGVMIYWHVERKST
ncbi:Tn3 family transposase [Amycolatopsis aidingensis]|uniref:Tn3 family transposase n=1 Tax=Amycolatopsis aidingensis TaxID=2842453 RepID=UPI0038CC137C